MSDNLILPVLPLTHSAWAPFGVLLQGTSDVSSLPSNITTKTTTANILPVCGLLVDFSRGFYVTEFA
jgi:hypothetical protein